MNGYVTYKDLNALLDECSPILFHNACENPWQRRDLAMRALLTQAYLACGYTGVEPVHTGEIQFGNTPPVDGWFDTMDEDSGTIWFNRNMIAEYTMSSRGASIHATLSIASPEGENGGEWVAGNNWNEGKLPEMPCWRRTA